MVDEVLSVGVAVLHIALVDSVSLMLSTVDWRALNSSQVGSCDKRASRYSSKYSLVSSDIVVRVSSICMVANGWWVSNRR
jgi:hypothetical protein